MPSRPVVRSLFVALMLASSLGLALADDATRMTIETTGEATVSAKPDFATITIGVRGGGRVAQSALAENSRAVAAVVEALKGAGVDAKDIQTADFSIWPQMAGGGGLLGFNVSNRVTVTVRDLARLGEALDKAAAGGANSIRGIQFGVTSPSAALDEARKAAFADARRKAELYAAEAGVKLVGLAGLEETSEGGAPTAAAPAKLAVAATPIEPGESQLTVSVRAHFEIAR
jgi:uncharacterized protein YggE